MKKIFAGLLVVLVLLTGAYFGLPWPGNVPVLMYHFIDTPERAVLEKNVVSVQSFKRQMDFLDRFGYHVISLEDYYLMLAGKRKPSPKEVVITFDDGNYTFKDHALAILEKHQFPVTVFVVSGNAQYQKHGSMDNPTIKKISESPLVTIGSHSRTHPVLAELDEAKLRTEILGSKEDLEKLIQKPVLYFAYPSGVLNALVLDIVKASGYRLAFTTSRKKLKKLPIGPLTITRVKISRTSDNPFAFWVRISGLDQAFRRIKID